MSETGNFKPRRAWRQAKGAVFAVACAATALLAVIVLGVLLVDIVHDGWGRLSWQFLDNFPSRKAEKAGIKAALMGSLWILGLTGLMSVPLGIAAAWLVNAERFKDKVALSK